MRCGEVSRSSKTDERVRNRFPRYESQIQKEPRRPVKIRTTVKTICCGLALAAVAHGQQIPPLVPPRAGFIFPQKQTLTYSVDWRVFPAGTAVIHFEAVGDRERLIASADTSGAINLLDRKSVV